MRSLCLKTSLGANNFITSYKIDVSNYLLSNISPLLSKNHFKSKKKSKTDLFITRYYISPMNVAQNLILVTSDKIYFQLLMIIISILRCLLKAAFF